MSALEALLYATALAAVAIAAIGLVAWLEAPVAAPLEPDTSRGLLPSGRLPSDAPRELG